MRREVIVTCRMLECPVALPGSPRPPPVPLQPRDPSPVTGTERCLAEPWQSQPGRASAYLLCVSFSIRVPISKSFHLP